MISISGEYVVFDLIYYSITTEIEERYVFDAIFFYKKFTVYRSL